MSANKILVQIGEFLGGKFKFVYDAITAHINDKNNPHGVTKGQVGLGSVDNTSDLDKPLSNVQQEALGNLNGGLSRLENSLDEHVTDTDIHHSTEGINGMIDEKVGVHNSSGESHPDIRNKVNGILDGNFIVNSSEYTEKLGDENGFYTKTTLDRKINKHIKNVTYDPDTAVFIFTYEDGTTTEVDTPIESTVKDGRLDGVTDELVLVLVSDQEIRIPISKLIKVYNGKETSTTTTTVSTDGKIGVDINQDSIEKTHLSETLLAEIQSHLKKTDDVKDNVVTFSESEVVENVVSGDKMSVITGKISKWFSAWSNKLSNLAENPNHTYASKDEVTAVTPKFNTLFLNTENLDDLSEMVNGALSDDLLAQFAAFDDLEKPFEVVINDGDKYLCDNVYTTYKRNGISISLDIPYKMQQYAIGNKITIAYDNISEPHQVKIVISTRKNNDIIFLTENGDGMINAQDRNWSSLLDKLLNGETPVVYLKSTENSGAFCPASYEFTKDATTDVISGFIYISYPKYVDGRNEWWIEKWVFENGITLNSQYQHSIVKVGSDRVPAYLVVEYPTDLSDYPDGSIFIKTA